MTTRNSSAEKQLDYGEIFSPSSFFGTSPAIPATSVPQGGSVGAGVIDLERFLNENPDFDFDALFGGIGEGTNGDGMGGTGVTGDGNMEGGNELGDLMAAWDGAKVETNGHGQETTGS
jgi:hypothetical protein